MRKGFGEIFLKKFGAELGGDFLSGSRGEMEQVFAGVDGVALGCPGLDAVEIFAFNGPKD